MTNTADRCQSCGMPLGEGFYGSEKDSSISHDYCTYCYQNGEFTMPDLTVDQAIEMSVEHMKKELKYPEEKAEKLATETITELKRWVK